MKLTREEADEYKRCRASALYTIEKYGHLRHIIRGKIKWVPYPWQEDLIEYLQSGQNAVILKSRQVGASWTIAGFVAWLILFNPDIEILLLSQKEKKAIKLLAKVKFVIDNFPDFIRRPYSSTSQTRLAVVHRRAGKHITSESSIDSLTTTGDSGRGDTARFVFLDEFAHLDNAEETWTSIKPTTSHGGQVVAASSPNGVSGAFARLWMQADGGESTFRAIRVHYTDCGFGSKWLADASDGMTDNQINQEFELVFLGTGSPAFDPTYLAKCFFEHGLPQELADLPVNKGTFASGIDSAEIRRNKKVRTRDFNAVVTFNEYGMEVASEANQMPLDEWAGKTEEIGGERVEMMGYVSAWHKKWPGLMLIEENGPGLTVENRHILPEDDVSEIGLSRTTSKSKPRLVNQFALALAGGLVAITSKALYYQLLTYEDLGNNQYSAPSGQYDDLVIAAILAYDALVEMGGYDFEMPERIVSLPMVPTELDTDFDPVNILIPTMGVIDGADVEIMSDWSEFDPRNPMYDLRQQIG